jgi:hypothetical protein
MVAIYSQTWNSTIGAIKTPSLAYEVVKIQAYPDQERFGSFIPAHESMPGSETWGQQGWTFTDLDKARAKFKELTARLSRDKLTQ